MRRALIAAAAVAFLAVAGRCAQDSVEMVRAFLKTPIERLPADHVDEFLAIDPQALPKELRRPFEARRLELYTLRQLAQRKKKGTVIMADDNCEVPHEAKANEIPMLRMAGYQEITEEEKQWVGDRTKCTEHDMLCEFTLQAVDETLVKGGKKTTRRRFFLYCKGAACDPLYVLIGVYRAKIRDANTPFFGVGGPVCAR